jgi:hypothetical protein
LLLLVPLGLPLLPLLLSLLLLLLVGTASHGPAAPGLTAALSRNLFVWVGGDAAVRAHRKLVGGLT